MDALPAAVEQHLEELRELCRKYHVKRLAVFGSAAKGTFDPERSDLDFVVEFLADEDPLAIGRNYRKLLEDLERLFVCWVDLVDFTAVRNPYFREELEETQLDVYDAA